MKTDIKQFNRQGDCAQRCGTLTLKAQDEVDATLLAMLARAIINDKPASRVRLFRSLLDEFPDQDLPDVVINDEQLREFACLGG